MDHHLNFVHIVNTYVNNVFAAPETEEESDNTHAQPKLREEKVDISFFHKSTYLLFTTLILILLIALCALSINFKSLFMSSNSIRIGIEDIIAPNEAGYKKIIQSLEHTYLQGTTNDGSKSKNNTQNETMGLDIELDQLTEVITYRDIRTQFDVGSWLQFALIPSAVEGFNSYNKLLGETILLTFLRANNEVFEYELDKSVFNKNGAIFNSQFGTTTNNDPFTLTYKYDNDPENKHTQNASNYQYIQGNNIDEMLNSLMQGNCYLDTSPYFPLNSILSHDSTESVSASMLTNNVISGTVSHINITFDFSRLNNVVQGKVVSDLIINKRIRISSFSVATGKVCLVIYISLAFLALIYLLYTFYFYRKYSHLFFYFDYVLEFVSKISLLLALVFYNIICTFRKSALPRVYFIDCTSGYCIPSVGAGNNQVFDKQSITSSTFNVIQPMIKNAININGVFCFLTLLTIISSSVLMWVFLNKKRKLAFLLKKYLFHLKIPFLSLICGTTLFTCLISSYNAYEANSTKATTVFFWQNVVNIFNLLSGVSNDSTSNFIAESGAITSILVILTLIISFYFGGLLFASLLLAINPNKNSVDLDTKKLDGPFDNFRFLQLQKGVANIARRVVTRYNVKIIRRLLDDNPPTDCSNPETIGSNPASADFTTYEPSAVGKLCKYICHALIVIGILLYSFNEYKSNKIGQIISDSMSSAINKRAFEWNYKFLFDSSVRYDQGENKSVNTKSMIITGNIRTMLQNNRIANRKDVLNTLDENHIGKSFARGNDGKLLFLNSRYHILPQNAPLFISFILRQPPPSLLFSGFERSDNFHLHLMSSNEDGFGLKRLFPNGVNRLPDIVKHVNAEFNVVDSLCENKLYVAKLSMDFNDSGLLFHEIIVDDLLGMSIPPKTSKFWIIGTFVTTIVLTFILGMLLILDIRKFGKGFNIYYPDGRVKQMVTTYFLNDSCRLSDLSIIIFFIGIIGCYVKLFRFLSFAYQNYENLDDIRTRIFYAKATYSIRQIQDIMVYFLMGVIILGFVLKIRTVRKFILIISTIVFELKFLYVSIMFYLVVTTSSLIFFFYFLPNDYFSGFSNESFVWWKSIKLVLSDYHFLRSLSDKSALESLLYPTLWISKILLITIISYFVWSIWPKGEESSKKTDAFDTSDDYKDFVSMGPGFQITSFSEEQLEVLHKDIKGNAAREALHLFSKFEEYNDKYRTFGETKGKFIEFLHDHVANELADLLKTSNNLEFQMNILSKQNKILEEISYKQLEDQILMLEEALADKSEELTCAFETYKK